MAIEVQDSVIMDIYLVHNILGPCKLFDNFWH
jgi:hypothetical protein